MKKQTYNFWYCFSLARNITDTQRMTFNYIQVDIVNQ